MKRSRRWAPRPPTAPWTPEEDVTLLEMTKLEIGFHDHTIEAVLPGRTVREAINRRYDLLNPTQGKDKN